MELRTGSVYFQPLRGSGPRTASQTIVFPRDVVRAVAGLSGYAVGFTGDDHHLGELDIQLDTQINADTVSVNVSYGLRDWSGDWDDNYDGTIQFVVIAELVPLGGPPPRGDLIITGVEVNQATQFFRSAQHLDPGNVRPDNSIRLIARKDTGVRVYVDYDASAGLPPISALSGTLTVTAPSGATIDIAPKSSIVPRRDNQIDRGQAGHTLNFMIPEAWSQGELTLSCRVFDAAAPAQKSAADQRTIRFMDVEPLRVFGVGVHYTGEGLDVAAPTQAELMRTLTYVEKTYPTGEVSLSGFTTIDFNKNMKPSDDSCGDGFNSLLDTLGDMRGDSTDVYYGILEGGMGIDSGNVAGCGGTGGGAAGFVDDGPTAAQEIAHVFGKNHAPCDSKTRCDSPDSPNDNYPKYDSYPSDSIGEFGFDIATNTVFDPATVADFMSYSPYPNWVSPYTYTDFMGSFRASSGISSSARAIRNAESAVQRSPERLWVKREHLFLRLTIARDRSVKRETSFHFAAHDRAVRRAGKSTGFFVELSDAKGHVLACKELIDACQHCDGNCWPKRLRQALAFPKEATKLVIFEGKHNIYEEDIGAPPKVEVHGKYDDKKQEIELHWTSSEEKSVWYLVQWLDFDGTWRGVCPRTEHRSVRVPARVVGRGGAVRFRVLASAAIATGVGECSLDLPTPRGETQVVLLNAPADGSVPDVLRVAVIDSSGRTVERPDIRWYDAHGREIARGRSVDVTALGSGEHVLRAVALHTAEPAVAMSYVVRRANARNQLVSAASDRPAARAAHAHDPKTGEPRHKA